MVIIRMVMIKIIMIINIEYINVIVRLVSSPCGHVKLDWLPTSKVDRVNENDKGNKNNSKDNDDKNNNKSDCNRDDEDDSNDNESDNENWMYWCNSEASEYKGWVIKLDLTTPVKF